MNYKNLYQQFISSRPIRNYSWRKKPKGMERHHILPLSLGGLNTQDNRILLTAREHFIAHRILAKSTTGSDKMKMALAVHRMSTGHQKSKVRISSRTYQYLRELRGKAYQEWLLTPKGIAFKQRQSNQSNKWTEERKKRVSQDRKLLWSDPEYKANRLKTMKHCWKALRDNRAIINKKISETKRAKALS
jgi:hypothetical protein